MSEYDETKDIPAVPPLQALPDGADTTGSAGSTGSTGSTDSADSAATTGTTGSTDAKDGTATMNTTEERDTPERPGLDLLHDTQPVPTGASTTTAIPVYPSLPPAYTLDDPTPDVAAVTTTPGPSAPIGRAAADPAPPQPSRTSRAPRVRTVTFGLVILAISVISLVALMTDARIDGGVVGLGLLIGAGAALVAGGISAAMREARGGPGAVR
jgi:hypothetical protein